HDAGDRNRRDLPAALVSVLAAALEADRRRWLRPGADGELGPSSRSASDLEQERERAQRGARSGLSLRAAAARGRFRRKAGHRRLSFRVDGADAGDRSEEHTSELQSLRHLVCRLRLEKTSKRLTV